MPLKGGCAEAGVKLLVELLEIASLGLRCLYIATNKYNVMFVWLLVVKFVQNNLLANKFQFNLLPHCLFPTFQLEFQYTYLY